MLQNFYLQMTWLFLNGHQWRKMIFAQLVAHYPYNHIHYGLQSFAVCDEKLMVDPILVIVPKAIMYIHTYILLNISHLFASKAFAYVYTYIHKHK